MLVTLGEIGVGEGERRRVLYGRRALSAKWLRQVDHARVLRGELVPSYVDGMGEVKPIGSSVARCGQAYGGVGLHSGETGGHLSGCRSCASVWACPVCGPRIRRARTEVLARAIASWQAEHGPGSVGFFTLTTSHDAGDGLEPVLDAIMRGWSKLISSSWWAGGERAGRGGGPYTQLGFARRAGLRGWMRSVESTYSGLNGWHPHAHGVFFFERSVTEAQRVRIQEEIVERWMVVQKSLGRRVNAEFMSKYGVDLRIADDRGLVLASYIAGVEKGLARWSLAQEVLRGDLKRKGSSVHPFHLLDGAGGERSQQLWVEWVDATRGRQCTTWSGSARALFGEVLQDLSDSEVLDLDTVSGELVEIVPARVWNSCLARSPLYCADVVSALAARTYTGPFAPPGYVPSTT